jgi:hypothetical protein
MDGERGLPKCSAGTTNAAHNNPNIDIELIPAHKWYNLDSLAEFRSSEDGSYKMPRSLRTAADNRFGPLNSETKYSDCKGRNKYQCLAFLGYIWAFHMQGNWFSFKIIQLRAFRWGRGMVAWNCWQWFLGATLWCLDFFSFEGVRTIATNRLDKFELRDSAFFLDFFRPGREGHCGKRKADLNKQTI